MKEEAGAGAASGFIPDFGILMQEAWSIQSGPEGRPGGGSSPLDPA